MSESTERSQELGSNPKTTEFTIDRSRWCCADNPFDPFEPSLLRIEDGKMCCLGFYSLACGLHPQEIVNVGIPSSLASDLPNQMRWLAGWNEGEFVDLENRLVGINDDPNLGGEDREEKIAKIFAEHGVTVRFVDSEGSTK